MYLLLKKPVYDELACTMVECHTECEFHFILDIEKHPESYYDSNGNAKVEVYNLVHYLEKKKLRNIYNKWGQSSLKTFFN